MTKCEEVTWLEQHDDTGMAKPGPSSILTFQSGFKMEAGQCRERSQVLLMASHEDPTAI